MLLSSCKQRPLSFATYLRDSMQVDANVVQVASLDGWREMTNVIVAGTREDLAGCGDALKASKDYRLIVAPERIAVCGFDDRGAMYGLYNLEHRMNLREAPMLRALARHRAAQPLQSANDALWAGLGRMA